VAGRDLEDAVEECAALVTAHLDGVGDGGLIPPRSDACREESFDLRGEVEGLVVKGVEERLDAEAIACGEEGAVAVVPENECKLPAQVMQAFSANLLVEVKGNLAVGAGTKTVASGLQIALDAFVVVELAVNDDVGTVVFGGDGLVAGDEIDDAEARVPESDAAIG
jgi:hypothetical protein